MEEGKGVLSGGEQQRQAVEEGDRGAGALPLRLM